MEKNKNIDELFRNKLADYEQEPPAYLLDNILGELGGTRKKKKTLWLKIAGVAAALAIALLAGWQLFQYNDLNNNRIATTSKINESTTATTALPVNEKMPTQNKLNESKEPTSVYVANNQNYTARKSMPATIKITETTANTSSNQLVALAPIKNIEKTLSVKTENTKMLFRAKKEKQTDVLAEKSIDQQIMEFNKQQMLASNKMKKETKIVVGAQVSPEYNVSQSSHSRAYASNMLRSTNQIDVGGGLSVGVKKGKKWSLQSGIYYSGIDQSSDNRIPSASAKDLYYNYNNALPGDNTQFSNNANIFNYAVNFSNRSSTVTLNSKSGVIELDKIPSGMVLNTSAEEKGLNTATIISHTAFEQSFDYIEIPIFVRYSVVDARFGMDLIGGFSSNILVGNQVFAEGQSGKSIGKTMDMEPLCYSSSLGLGFKYGLTKHISLNIEPRMKYYLKSINSNASVNYKPYSIGIYTGLSYEF